MGYISPTHVLVVVALIIVLFLLAPRRLPELGEGFGRALHNFKSGVSGREQPPPDTERTADTSEQAK